MGYHPMVRADTPFSYMPGAKHGLQRFDHLKPAVLLQSQDEPLHLDDGGHEAEQYPAHYQRVANARNRLPWLGDVEDYSIDIAFGDALVDVTKLDL